MLTIDKEGMVADPKVTAARAATIERATMDKVNGIIVHQTGGATAESSLSSYKAASANGAHFLIDKDGKIYQTASIYKQTWHVGKLQSRCLLEKSCSEVDVKALKKFNPTRENTREMEKAVPERYPANVDSIGIEIVGKAVKDVYETVNEAQNASLVWLVAELSSTLKVPMTEVFRHPTVSRKNPTEASTAKWQ